MMYAWSWSIAFFLAATVSAAAGDFPNRPVRLLVPFSVGGPTDTAARLVAQPLQQQFNQTVIIENMPGGSGVPGVQSVVDGANDGYTLVVGGIAPIVLVPAGKKLSYDVQKDLVPLGLIWRTPQVLAVRSSLGVDSVSAFVDYAKKKPGEVTVGSAGVGTVTHLANELLQQEAGIRLLHIPYHSTSNSLTDLMGGQIDSIFGDAVTLKPQLQAGTIKALAVTSTRRSPLLPNVPTMAEAGLPNVQTEVWYGTPGARRHAGAGAGKAQKRRAGRAARPRLCGQPAQIWHRARRHRIGGLCGVHKIGVRSLVTNRQGAWDHFRIASLVPAERKYRDGQISLQTSLSRQYRHAIGL